MATRIWCAACRLEHQEWTWQPFGPADDALCFTLPGSHYRGFPTVALCETCKRTIEAGGRLQFKSRGRLYLVNHGDVQKW